MKLSLRKQSVGMSALVLACVAVLALSASTASAAWSFGVMADTQWSGSDPTGNNINTVAVNQAKACNQAFVAAGVDFVIQVGDLTDTGTNAGLQTRLDANSALAAANIPFYGLRGNHEDNSTAKTFFQSNYIPTSSANATVAVATDGISYSVTHNNTKVVLLDILTADSTGAMDAATSWMGSQLSAADHNQAFVFQHKNLLGQNHKDNAFGGSNDANPAQQNAFISTLQNSGVRYDITGHDHMDYRSTVTSPDGTSQVQQLICASDSYKYYTPGAPFSTRDAPIAQQLYETGYYLFTVDGPRVTGQYFHTTPLANGDVPANPVWKLGETFGYSLNGKEFLVASNGDLSVVKDTFNSTSMSLSGINASTVKTSDGRLVSKDINTGWTELASGFASSALTLWGMEDTDQQTIAGNVTLNLNYDPKLIVGTPVIEQKNADGTWTALPTTLSGGVVSATISHDGTFAVGSVPEPSTIVLLGMGALAALAIIRRRMVAK